jgi:predicted HAD superfamily Cof-like phosphohydrolase
MLHKKQAHQQIERTIQWNLIRGNTTDTLDWDLELSMLQEELDELRAAASSNSPVDIFDALMDIKFVLMGTCGKFGLSAEQVVDGYEAVLNANEHKSATKDQFGKITKPADWHLYKPEPKLQQILIK